MVNKYIVYNKIKKVIDSCITLEHVNTVKNYCYNFNQLYDDGQLSFNLSYHIKEKLKNIKMSNISKFKFDERNRPTTIKDLVELNKEKVNDLKLLDDHNKLEVFLENMDKFSVQEITDFFEKRK